MDISIVLCAFNGEKYLRAQLDSLQAQTLPPCEVIIADDASADGTAALAAGYIRAHGLDRWRLSMNEVNLGYRRNFRDAALRARGDWIAFCDQDDVWRPDKLARLAHLAQAHPEARAAAGSFDLIDGEGRPIPSAEPPGQANHGMIHLPLAPGEVHVFAQGRRDAALMLSGNPSLGCTAMFRRETVSAWAGMTAFALPHDWELALLAWQTGGFCFLNEPVIDYRLHGGNVIGLPESAVAGPKGPSLAGRVETMNRFEAALQCAQAQRSALGLSPLGPAFAQYAALRREALAGRSLVKWLALQRFHGLYADMFTRRQRLGDLYLILFGEKRRGAL